MKKIIARAIAVAIVMLPLAACGDSQAEPVDRNIDTGVVVSRDRKHITVLEDDGERDQHTVSKKVAKSCAVGKRWPDCKKR